jgi:hypothetical protein
MQNKQFDYCNVSNRVIKNETHFAYRSKGGYISLRTFECEKRLKNEPNPPGWKLHISIDDENDNMERAWNTAVYILIHHNVSFAKFILITSEKDKKEREYECGRHFTIYVEQNPEKTRDDWQNIINDITEAFVQNNIKPGYRNIICRQIPGSSFFYYRNDTAPDEQVYYHDIARAELTASTASEQTVGSATEISATIPMAPELTASNASPPSLKVKNNWIHIPALTINKARTEDNESIIPNTEEKKRSTISSVKVYRYKEKEVWYNPSGSDESFMLELVVKNDQQQKPKDFTDDKIFEFSKPGF